jgi:hypothetical protein
MAANVSPIFILVPQVQWGTSFLTAANTAKDGTGTVLTCWTTGAESGFVQRIRFRPVGTNVATVARVFVNNGSANTTAANNILFAELTLPLTTITETAAQPDYELPLNFGMPTGYKINVVLGTAVAAGYAISVVGGSF